MEPDYLNYESIQLLSRTKLEILNQSLFRPKFYSTIIEYETGDTFTMYKLEYGILDSDGKHIQIYRNSNQMISSKNKEISPTISSYLNKPYYIISIVITLAVPISSSVISI